MRRKSRSRSGATMVEFAIVCPIMLLLILGTIVGGLGIFRYQELAAMARDGSRWLSVRGAEYASETGNKAATGADMYNDVLVPENAALNLNKLSYSVSWNTSNALYHTTIVNNELVPVTNTVTVTLTYQWIPEAYFKGVTLSSTSVTPMAY